MQLTDLPVENLKNICSFLGGYSYVANMVPYLRSCVTQVDKVNFITAVYERGDFAFIYLYNLLPLYQNVKECIRPLVRAENQTLLSWLLSRKPAFLSVIGREAAEQGSYKILTWCMFQGYKIRPHDIGKVIASRNTKLCQHLQFLGYHCDKQAELAFYGHLEILCKIKNLDPYLVSEYAAQGGHLCILQWLREEGLLDKKATLNGAVKGMRREIILWLGKVDLSSCYSLVAFGSEEEKIDFLEWLEKRTEVNYSLVAFRSAHRGYMKVVRWCVERKEKLHPRFLSGVFRRGTRKDLELFSSLGYPVLDDKYHHQAFQTANIDVLLWLDEKMGRVYNFHTATQNAFPHFIAEENIIAYFEWLCKKGFSINLWLLSSFIRSKKGKVLAWMTKHIPLHKDMVQTFLEKCIEVSCLETFVLFFNLNHGLCKEEVRLLLRKTPRDMNLYNPLFTEEVEKLLR